MCVYVCVCMSVTLRKQRSYYFPFQIKYIIHKKIYQPLGPQNTPFSVRHTAVLFIVCFVVCVVIVNVIFCYIMIQVYVSRVSTHGYFIIYFTIFGKATKKVLSENRVFSYTSFQKSRLHPLVSLSDRKLKFTTARIVFSTFTRSYFFIPLKILQSF